jgi:pimeloyl-ACP methyl ester carboxylesterase
VEYARELSKLVPNGDLEVLGGAGHLPMFETPDEFVGVVQKFLARG